MPMASISGDQEPGTMHGQQEGSSKLDRPGRGLAAAAARNPSMKIGFETESTWQTDKDLEAKVGALSTKDLRGKALLTLSFAALGVIFGDLGTSPLYAMQAVFVEPPRSSEDVLGVVSLIFWSLTLLAVVKYVLLVMSANDNGEGGTFAMYSLLCRAIGIGPYGQQLPIDTAVYNYDEDTFSRRDFASCDIHHPAGAWLRRFIRRHKRAQVLLLVLVILASAMLIGDGVLTPAISVLSAVSGLRLATDKITQPVIVGVTIIILVLLFMLQRVGTHRVSIIFAPVLLVWFMFNASIGFYNISKHGWEVWRALSPSYGIQQFTSGFHTGWMRLGGVVLAVTGVEAMYADLGHFSRPAVSLSFLCVVYPSLVVTYLGQGAYLIAHPEAHGDPFWRAIPTPVFWPMLVVATFATIVASQALISGAFSLMRQAMMLGVFPRLTVMHTSEHVAGQVYIEEVNFLLMVGCIAVVAGFRDTAALGNAYGVAVVTLMLCTTILFSLVMLLVWQLHPLLVAAFFLFFGLIEGLFLTSNYTKVPTGGWVALLIGALVAAFELTYWYGSRKKAQYTRAHMVPVSELIVQDMCSEGGDDALEPLAASAGQHAPLAERQWSMGSCPGSPGGRTLSIGRHRVLLPQLRLATTGQLLERMPGLGVVYSETVAGVPLVLQHLLKNIPVVFEINVFLTLRFIPIPYVSKKERFLVRISRSFPGIYHVVARYGYMDVVDQSEAFVRDMVTSVAAYMQCSQHAQAQQQSPHGHEHGTDSPQHHTIDMQQLRGTQHPSPLTAASSSTRQQAAQASGLMKWASMDMSADASVLLNMEPEAAVSASRCARLASTSMPSERRSQSHSRVSLQRLSTVPERRVRMALMAFGPDAMSAASKHGDGSTAAHTTSSPRTAARCGPVGATDSGMTVVSVPLQDDSARIDEFAGAADAVVLQDQQSEAAGHDGHQSSAFTTFADSTEQSSSPGQDLSPARSAPSSRADRRGAIAFQRSLSQHQQDLMVLLDAYKRHKVYLIGRSNVRCAPNSNFAKRVVIGLYRLIVSNTRTVTDAWRVPRQHLLEVTHDVKV